MFEYEFMRRALLVGLLLGLMIPLMGVIVVNRRTSTIGDALSHASLAGIGLGLLAGVTPLIGSVVITIIGAFAIEMVRHRFPKNGDLATAMVMSTGVGLASILSDIVPSNMNFESYLFGSIVTILPEEVTFSVLLAGIVLIVFFTLYFPLLYLSVDPNGARLTGLPTRLFDSIFTALLAITIAMGARTIGALMVSSLMILPVATSLFFTKSYRATVYAAMVLGAIIVVSGLAASYYLDLKPGGAIVFIGIGIFAIAWIVQLLTVPRTKEPEEKPLPPLADQNVSLLPPEDKAQGR